MEPALAAGAVVVARCPLQRLPEATLALLDQIEMRTLVEQLVEARFDILAESQPLQLLRAGLAVQERPLEERPEPLADAAQLGGPARVDGLGRRREPLLREPLAVAQEDRLAVAGEERDAGVGAFMVRVLRRVQRVGDRAVREERVEVQRQLLLHRPERVAEVSVAGIAAHRLVAVLERLLVALLGHEPLRGVVQIEELLVQHEAAPPCPGPSVAVPAARDDLRAHAAGGSVQRLLPAVAPVGPQGGPAPGQDDHLERDAVTGRLVPAQQLRAHLVGVRRADDAQEPSDRGEGLLGIELGRLEQIDEVDGRPRARRGRRRGEAQGPRAAGGSTSPVARPGRRPQCCRALVPGLAAARPRSG
jgi:hypothetical protein